MQLKTRIGYAYAPDGDEPYGFYKGRESVTISVFNPVTDGYEYHHKTTYDYQEITPEYFEPVEENYYAAGDDAYKYSKQFEYDWYGQRIMETDSFGHKTWYKYVRSMRGDTAV